MRARDWRALSATARRVARTLAFETPRATTGSTQGTTAIAAAGLLLLVAAAASLLRLSARVSNDVLRGRPG